ncbi:MAG: adenylosuccinate lyase [Brevinematales bacterium]|nr:adenylosuccinate lyase [Brevinematales bacterium]
MSVYKNPLETRYASKEMLDIFSEEHRYQTWRDVWIALAETEYEMGLPVTADQVAELKAKRGELNLERASEIEREIHHDVMSHIRAYGEAAPGAAGIIHLGATSAFVTDNAEMMMTREALLLIKRRLLSLMAVLRDKADQYKDLPVLGYTHLQPAQPTSLGKRISLWLYDLYLDYKDLEYRLDGLITRGAKGTTGTQASFMKLFEGDEAKVRDLDRTIARKLGFRESVPVSGQTLTRKVDFQILSVLSSIGQSAHRAANDIRILQHSWQVEEPFSEKQVGSSAMPYKRNPILAERMSSLARYLISLLDNSAYTFAFQFLERTLDDSANRRMLIPEAFLLADSILIVYTKTVEGMKVYPEVIRTEMVDNLPFYATENILMEAVKHGGDRQELHEVIREFAMRKVDAVRAGKDFDMLGEMRSSGKFPIPDGEWAKIGDLSAYIGRAPGQVREFLSETIDPLLAREKDFIGIKSDIRV